MSDDRSDKDKKENVEYHLYPYSYDEDIKYTGEEDNESGHTIPNGEKEPSEAVSWKKDTEDVSKDTLPENSHNAEDNIKEKTSPIDHKAELKGKERPYQKSHKGPDSLHKETTAKGSSGRKWQYIAAFVVLFFIIAASFAVIYHTFNGELYPSNEKVAVIYVQGTLVTGNVPGGLGYVSSEEVSDNIRRALRDKSVKAIVLRVNSGGGSSTAGEEVYTEVKRASQSGVPVIISMGDVAASAAYHISAPADLIVANPSTMTGSIGTIWIFQDLSDYYEEEGVKFYIAKSGEFKDMGGTWRGLSDDEKEYANRVVTEVYQNFVENVADGRELSIGEVTEISDGRIYTGREAKELGLVDEMGNLYYAIDRAAEIGGIEGAPSVVYMNRPTLASLLFGSDSEHDIHAEDFLRYYEENPYGQIR